jgi:hypothetical protein
MTIWIFVAVIILGGQVTFAVLFWMGKEGEHEHPIYRKGKGFKEMRVQEINSSELQGKSSKKRAVG